MKKFIIPFILLPLVASAQDDDWDFGEEDEDTEETVTVFKDTRIINGHSVETLEAQTLDFRITHRFGDMATPASGRTLFGLDNSTDIRIAFEYGIIDGLNVGFGRSKGSGPLSEFWDGYTKYKILTQSNKMPLSLSVSLSGFFTSMKADEFSLTSPTSFAKTAHRFSYYSQLIAAKKFGEHVALQIAPGYLHRNYVAYEDENGLFCVGGALNVHIWKKLSFVTEYVYVLRSDNEILGTQYTNPLGVGLEIETHAHVFQLSFMNSRGIGEGQFIPYTSADWGDGEYRFGFTISRRF